LARGLITGDADLAAPALRQEVFQYIFNTLRPNGRSGKNYMVEYSDLVHAYLPSGSSAFQATEEIDVDAYLGTRVFGLRDSVKEDLLGVNYRTWTRDGRYLTGTYLAETEIDTIVTEKTWTGGDLALAYEWDDAIELWVNGSRFVTKYGDYGAYTGGIPDEIAAASTVWKKLAADSSVTLTGTVGSDDVIRRGSKVEVLPAVGLKVQLFDSGDYTNTRNADNGKIGKVVITYEYLAQITKVDNNAKTIDLEVFDELADGTKKVTVKGYSTDDTYAVRDYVVVILEADSLFGYAHTGATADSASILNLNPAESVEVKATNYTRNTNYLYVHLATVTAGDQKYIFNSYYRFGDGDVPSFETECLLILDSNGRVIGITGDVAGPAARKYAYVSAIRIYDKDAATSGWGAPSVRAYVTYPLTGDSAYVDIPVKKVSGVYYAVINGMNVPIASINTDASTGLVVNGVPASDIISGTSYDLVYENNLTGWYWYTSADDASTITLRSNRAGTNNYGAIYTHQETNGYIFGVGQVSIMASPAMPRGISGGFTSDNATVFGGVYADSKTVEYYNGVKYTGYASFPYGIGTGSAPGGALAIQGPDGVLDALFVVGEDATPTAPATFGIIKKLPLLLDTSLGRLTYEVVGSTGAITSAWEESDNYDPTYELGDIVDLIRQDDGTYKIPSTNTNNGHRYYAAANLNDFVTPYEGYGYVTRIDPNRESFEVSGGVGTVTWSSAFPHLDITAPDNEGDRFPELYDFVRVTKTPMSAVEAVVTLEHTTAAQLAAAETAVDSPFSSLALSSGNGSSASPFELPAASGSGGKFIFGWNASGGLYSTDTIAWDVATADAYYMANNLTSNGLAGYGQTLYNLISTSNFVTMEFQDVKDWVKADGESSEGTLTFHVKLASLFDASYSETYYVKITGLTIS
jgi:hypothetical protein